MKYTPHTFFFLLALTVSLLCPGSAQAAVLGDSSIQWTVPSGGSWTFGGASEYAGEMMQIDHATIMSNDLLFLNFAGSTLSGTASDGHSQIGGTFDYDNGSAAGNISVLSAQPANANWRGTGLSVLSAWYTYEGVLSDLAYQYAFNGSKDSAADYLSFSLQTAVSYLPPGDFFIPPTSVVLQNDYDKGAVFPLFVHDNADLGPFSHQGSKQFDDYSSFGIQRWTISYDLIINGTDTRDRDPQTAVPEASTVMMMGAGLLGLIVLRRWIRFGKSK